MRKLEINNILISSPHGRRDDILGIIGGTMFTPTELSYEEKTRLSDSYKDCGEWVVIDDSREERETLTSQDNGFKRGFITTGEIYNTVLQTNRGKQNIEWQKNRWFAEDNNSNHNQFQDKHFFPLLDIMWKLKEEGYDACVIKPKEEGNTDQWEPISKRYKKALNYGNKIARENKQECIDAYEKAAKEHTKKGEIDYCDLMGAAGEIRWMADDDNPYPYKRMVYDYASYRYYFDDDEEKGKAKPFKNWLTSRRLETTKELRPLDLLNRLEWIFAYQSGLLGKWVDESTLFERYHGSIHTHKEYQLIGKSQWKRCENYYTTIGNFVKAEILRLRKLGLEGTYEG